MDVKTGHRMAGATLLAWLVALLAASAAQAAAPSTSPVDQQSEAAVMHKLRESVHAWNPDWSQDWAGWQPGGPPNPCEWHKVECDGSGHVTVIAMYSMRDAYSHSSMSAERDPELFPAGTDGGPGPLLPDLARLQRLQRLEIRHEFAPLAAGIPPQWVQPGAFPSLQRLHIAASSLGAPLPDVSAAALPQLQQLFLFLPALVTSLPASWGAGPRTLPHLVKMDLCLAVSAPLPPAWARGFPALALLFLRGTNAEMGRHAPLGGLPPEWADGFSRLEALGIDGIPTGGTRLPAAWVARGSTNLQTLQLMDLQLTGTLPAELPAHRPNLMTIDLHGNNLTGSLPEEWAKFKTLDSVVLSNNRLTGPAFPPAWLEAGSLPSLRTLSLSGNPALTGTLPAGLAWPVLEMLRVDGTGVVGPIPPEWCRGPSASSLRMLAIANTSIPAALPACAARHMPRLKIVDGPPVAHTSWLPVSGGAVLAAAAAAVAATASTVLVRRQRRRRVAGAAPPGEHTQLLMSLAKCSSSNGSAPGRLAALLSSYLGGQHRAEVFPVEALRQAFMHQVGAPCEPLPGSLGAPAAGGSVPSGGGAGAAASRRWGLATQGMRLSPEQVEFVVHPGGGFVELGAGAHAAVYLGRLGGTEVAIKAFELSPGTSSRRIWQEAAVLRDTAHPRLLPLHGVAIRGQLVLLVTGLMRGGSLRRALGREPTREQLRWSNRGRQVAIDIAEALECLHTVLQTRHTDLKAKNVLLDEHLRACVADLGMAQFVGRDARTVAGFSATHAAPEQLLGQKCTLAVDMYALGVLLLELTTNTCVKKRGGWRLPHAPQECPQEVADLIQACLALDPAQRPSAADALRTLRGAAPS